MRAIPVKLLVSGEKKCFEDFYYTPTYSALLSRFLEASESPPIGHGAFTGRCNRRTDHAGTVTNVLGLAQFLLDPTFRVISAHIHRLMFHISCSVFAFSSQVR
jgi:hypothetical protein